MKKWAVIVTRDTTESVTLLVDADTPEGAEDEARRIASERAGDLHWKQVMGE